MSTKAEHIYALVKDRATERGCRVKKLESQGARDDAINRAAWRLILQQQRFGNIRDYIEGNFWDEDGDARNTLIDNALDAGRQAVKRATKPSGGTPEGEPTDRAAWDDFVLYADRDPLDPYTLPRDLTLQKLERDEQLEAETAAEDTRDQIEDAENEQLRLARNAFAETLPMRHRKALFLMCNEPKLTNSTIAAKVSRQSVKGIKPETVSRLRDKLTELANGILTRSPEDLYMEELERLAHIAKAEAKVRRAEQRLHRAQWALSKSAAELAAFRAFAAPLCEELGMSVDDLLGASIAPKT